MLIAKQLAPTSYSLLPVSVISVPLLTAGAILRRCRLLLANDSGLMHLAAAVGVATFAIFGPTDERATGPRGVNSHVIRAPGTKPVYDTERNFDLGQEAHTTMLAVSARMVLDDLRKYI